MTIETVNQLTSEVEAMKIADDVIVEGPTVEKKWNEKRLKKVCKEGGKRGVEIEGAADMGGLQFFCTNLLEPAGEMEYLIEATKAMNAKCDPSEEERKGGAGKIGKIVMSSTDTSMSLVAYVPTNHAEKCSAKSWLENVMERAIDTKAGRDAAIKFASYDGISEKNWYTAEIKNNADANVFIMKFRDAIISHAYAYLRPLGLFPEDDEEDDDDCCWGDEDMDAMMEEEVVEEKEEEVVEGEHAAEEEKKEEEEDVIVPGPNQEGKKWNEKRLKKVCKEGGKRGVEIEGAADMGGLQFFCTSLLEPAGDMEYLIEATKAMNAKCDPSEEERKGGAGKIGKIVMSSTETKMALVAYVPKQHADKCSARTWLEAVLASAIDSKDAREKACKIQEFEGIENKNWCVCTIENNQDANVFIMKFRDAIISYAYAYLRPLGLFPEDDDEDDDEYCFGDDDFDL